MFQIVYNKIRTNKLFIKRDQIPIYIELYSNSCLTNIHVVTKEEKLLCICAKEMDLK